MNDQKNKPCKRLPADATKDQRILAALVKKQVKNKLRDHARNRMLEYPEFVLANQSKHNENYGETPAEQRKRELEKSS